MRRLAGVGVLVTRPQAQSAELCRLLEAHGATTFAFPAITIDALATPPEFARRIGDPNAFDLVVFTSANAVRHGAALLGPRRDRAIAAIGPATRRALDLAGYPVAITPRGGFDSEHLLAEPALRDLAGRRVLLVKGVGGRDLLARELAARGARVESLEVYRRSPAAPEPARLRELEDRLDAGALQVVTATSVEIATALLAISTPRLRAVLARLHWLAPAGRVASALDALGVRGPRIAAASPEDPALLEALSRWAADRSGDQSNESK
jgi:uroporphyrinogen-III synthase